MLVALRFSHQASLPRFLRKQESPGPPLARVRPGLPGPSAYGDEPQQVDAGTNQRGRGSSSLAGRSTCRCSRCSEKKSHDEIEAIIDWKSDIEMNADRFAGYLRQLEAYRKEIGAKRAILVFMTLGKVVNL